MSPPKIPAGAESAYNQQQDDRDEKENATDAAGRFASRLRTSDFLIIKINDDAIAFHVSCSLGGYHSPARSTASRDRASAATTPFGTNAPSLISKSLKIET